jgi:hypothetical protein
MEQMEQMELRQSLIQFQVMAVQAARLVMVRVLLLRHWLQL